MQNYHRLQQSMQASNKQLEKVMHKRQAAQVLEHEHLNVQHTQNSKQCQQRKLQQLPSRVGGHPESKHDLSTDRQSHLQSFYKANQETSHTHVYTNVQSQCFPTIYHQQHQQHQQHTNRQHSRARNEFTATVGGHGHMVEYQLPNQVQGHAQAHSYEHKFDRIKYSRRSDEHVHSDAVHLQNQQHDNQNVRHVQPGGDSILGQTRNDGLDGFRNRSLGFIRQCGTAQTQLCWFQPSM